MRKLSEDMLMPAFNQLTSVEEKLQFWKEDLKHSYIDFLVQFNEKQHLHAFQIIADPEEYKNFNKWIIDNFRKQLTVTNKTHAQISFEELKESFEEKIKYRNRQDVIRNELQRIDKSFITVSNNKHSYTNNHKFNADYNTYNNYISYRQAPDYSKIFPDLHAISIENGKELACYKIYLESLLSNNGSTLPEKVLNSVETKHTLTNAQLALLFKYTGILDGMAHLESNKAIAKIFSDLLGVSYKSIYDAIREVNTRKTKSKENLQVLANYLTEKAKILPTELTKDLAKSR